MAERTVKAMVLRKAEELPTQSVSNSKQLDQVSKIDKKFRYTKDNLVKPELDLFALVRLYKTNYAHAFCVNTKAACISGMGWRLASKLSDVYGINDQEMLAEITRLTDRLNDSDAESLTPEEQTRLDEYSAIYTQHQADKKVLDTFFEDINPATSFDEINQNSDIDREHIGFMCWEAIRNGKGEIAEIWHMPAATVRMMANGLGVCQIRTASSNDFGSPYTIAQNGLYLRRVFFQFIGLPVVMDMNTGEIRGVKVLDDNGKVTRIEWFTDEGGKSLQIPPEQWANEVIIHRKYNPDNYWYGMPDIISALSACSGDRSASGFQEDFFDNNTVPRMAVVIQGTGLSDEAKETIERFFDFDMKGKGHSTLVLEVPGEDRDEATGERIPPVDVKFERLAMDMTDASFKEYRRENRDQIFVAHRVPGSLSPVPNNLATKDTAMVDLETFKSQVIRPIQKSREHLIYKYLIKGNFGITTWELKFNEIDSIDQFRLMQIYRGYLSENAMTVNEVRKELNLPPKKGGDRAFRITPLGIVFLDEMEELSTGDVSAKPSAPLSGADQGGTDGGRPPSEEGELSGNTIKQIVELVKAVSQD